MNGLDVVLLSYVSYVYSVNYFFFFQAEDGIRDLTVTGVQTCALPICPQDAARGGAFASVARLAGPVVHRHDHESRPAPADGLVAGAGDRARHVLGGSEERRVGEESRSRWSAYP